MDSSQPPQHAPQLTLTRLLNAPRELVFKVWTQPEHFARWLGPKDFVAIACQVNAQPGGLYRACIRSPEGHDHWMQGVYREVVAPERLVFTFAWEDERGQPGHPTLVTVTLAAQGSQTQMTFHQAIFESTESRDSHHGGWAECFDRLANYVDQIAQPERLSV